MWKNKNKNCFSLATVVFIGLGLILEVMFGIYVVFYINFFLSQVTHFFADYVFVCV